MCYYSWPKPDPEPVRDLDEEESHPPLLHHQYLQYSFVLNMNAKYYALHTYENHLKPLVKASNLGSILINLQQQSRRVPPRSSCLISSSIMAMADIVEDHFAQDNRESAYSTDFSYCSAQTWARTC